MGYDGPDASERPRLLVQILLWGGIALLLILGFYLSTVDLDGPAVALPPASLRP